MEVQTKITRNTTAYLLKQSKFKWLKIPNIGKNVEYLELSYIVGGNVKWYNHFKNKLAVS